MEDLIQSVRLKLQRAAVQRAALLQLTTEWVNKNQATARFEHRPAKHGFRLILDPFAEAPPLDVLGLLFGEYAHNLRSALDNLAFALARLQNDPPKNPRDLAFPIFANRNAFQKIGQRYLQQLPPAAAELIEKLQPYNRDVPGGQKLSDQDLIFLLQRFNNMDKHQVPSIVLLAPKEMNLECDVEFETDEAADLNVPPDATFWGGPLAPGVTLLEYRTKHPLKSAKVNLKFHANVSVICGDDRYEFVETVQNLHNYTCLVADQFVPFFAQR